MSEWVGGKCSRLMGSGNTCLPQFWQHMHTTILSIHTYHNFGSTYIFLTSDHGYKVRVFLGFYWLHTLRSILIGSHALCWILIGSWASGEWDVQSNIRTRRTCTYHSSRADRASHQAHSLTHALTHSLTHSLTHAPILTNTHALNQTTITLTQHIPPTSAFSPSTL